MEVTPVGEDLHILLTGGDHPYLGCIAYATPVENPENPEESFCIYVADRLCKATGKTVVCSGGIYVPNPTKKERAKLVENVDDLIKDWVFFYAD